MIFTNVFKSFSNSWRNSYTSCLLLIITLLFTCGEKKICSSIKMSQNIMNIVVAVKFLRRTFKWVLSFRKIASFRFVTNIKRKRNMQSLYSSFSNLSRLGLLTLAFGSLMVTIPGIGYWTFIFILLKHREQQI